MVFLANNRYKNHNTDAFVVVKTDSTVTKLIAITIYDIVILGTTPLVIDMFHSDIRSKYKLKRLDGSSRYLGGTNFT